MPDLEDQINPQEPMGNAAAKGVGSMVGTAAMFIVGHVAGIFAYRKGKGALFNALIKSGSKSNLRSAAKYAREHGDSGAAFISKAGWNVSPAADKLFRMSTNTASMKFVKDTQNMNILEKYRATQNLNPRARSMVRAGAAARYTREAAVLSPMFYVAEVNMGLRDKEGRGGPSWYNIPGHAVNYMKYIPEYVGLDLLGRGAFGMARAGLKGLGTSLEKSMPDGMQKSLVKATAWLQEGRLGDVRVGDTTLGNMADKVGAYSNAFTRAVKDPTRKKLLYKTQDTLSGYRESPIRSKGDWFKSVTKAVKNVAKQEYSTRVKTRKDANEAYRTGKGRIETDFEDYINFMGPKGNGASKTSAYQKVLIRNDRGAVKQAVHKTFYNEGSSQPFLARFLGLTRARGSDYIKKKEGATELHNLYRRVKNYAPGGKKGSALFQVPKQKGYKQLTKPIGEREFVENVISQGDNFIHKESGKIIDIDKMRLGYWADKFVRGLPSVAGFHITDLTPIKIYTARKHPRALALTGKMPLHPQYQVQGDTDSGGFKSKLYKVDQVEGQVTYNNVYDFGRYSKELAGQQKYGLALRSPGGKRYDIYDAQLGKFTQVGKNAKMALAADSIKQSKVYYEMMASDISGRSHLKRTLSDNPMVRFAQEHLDLFHKSRDTSGVWDHAKAWIPKGISKYIIDDAPNNSRDIIRNITRFAEDKTFRSRLHDLDAGENAQFTQAVNETLKLGNKVQKKAYDKTLSSDSFFSETLEFVKLDKKLNINSIKDIINNPSELVKLAKRIRKNDFRGGFSSGGKNNAKQVDTLLSQIDAIGMNAITKRSESEIPLMKLKRYVHDYAVESSYRSDIRSVDGGKTYQELLLNKAEKLYKAGNLSDQQLASVEFGLFTGDLQNILGATQALHSKGTLTNIRPEATEFLDRLTTAANTRAIGRGDHNVLTNYKRQISHWDTAFDRTFDTDHVGKVVSMAQESPWVAYPGDMKDWFVGKPFSKDPSMLGGWINSTTRRLITGMGLGWDRTRYDTPGKIFGLWGKRAGAYGALALGYNAVDTFTDVSGLFDWSPLDEGTTVAAADQAVKLRMGAGFVYDALGVDNVARYMEGLMPGSSKFIPGAAMGLMAGGAKGALVGGLLQSYLQPQLAEGPLAFLAVAPPLAPFVTDMTKDFDELQDIYEGSQMVPYRKGAGWTLGNTPIEGGRIEQYVPNWYARLKSQYKASPLLYGSKMEQFLAKDLPFLDIAPMDFIDPQYLTYKQYEDRPYVIPDTPFAEVPVVGPVLGATVGRVWNWIHPLGKVSPLHEQEATKNFFAGQNYDWKGNPTNQYGPSYGGATMFGIDTQGFNMPGANPNDLSLHSPFHAKPVIGEQIYRGWIEWFGLPGFATSAMLWGGDEPFTDLPVTPSAQEMDSMGRSFWEQNLGDMAMTNELFRRFVPRPRTSYETVDLVRNTMPTWMPESMSSGDPYCLLPDTEVETNKGLVSASNIEAGMLVKTLQGRYMPVEGVLTRPVDEEIYVITLKGLEDKPIKVTGGHPFYINHEWVHAKDLIVNDYVAYPSLNIELEDQWDTKEYNYLGALARWCAIDNTYSIRKEAPIDIKAEINYIENYFLSDGYSKKELTTIINKLQIKGLDICDTKLVNICNYISHFKVPGKDNNIEFRFHTRDAAYKIWSILLSFNIFSSIKDTKIIVEKGSAIKVEYFMNELFEEIKPLRMDESIRYESGKYTTKHSDLALIPIVEIKKEFYKGNVYTIDVDEDSTYCVPGAVVHNSKIAFGELLLPGAAYEDYFNPNISFPVGMSRLGYDSYEQALGMIGIRDISKEAEEILETGTALHKMVQDQLMASGTAVKVEALVSSPKEEIRSYVDAMLPNPQGGLMPLEIKSISDKGFSHLTYPKWKHRVQLNAYLAVMGANQGKMLYVNREDPNMTKEFTVRFDSELWDETLDTMHEARDMARGFLQEGYGRASHGYSYVDRMRVLMNAAPFSSEFRETEKLLGQQAAEGYLSVEEEEKFSTLQQQHTHMMRKYDMYPRRFRYDQLLNPDDTYTNFSTNQHIKPASDYNIAERILGGVWESFTHMKSPVHSKLIGHYSPEEQYERKALYGVPFQSWADPVDSFIKPYARGLRAVENPGQGALSWGTGGALLGGLPGAVAGGIIGGAYGTAHGMYRAVFGGKYQPDNFKEKTSMANYFDTLEYERNMTLFNSTGDDYYRQQAYKTVRGAVTQGTGFSDFNDMGAPGMYMTMTPKVLRTSNIWSESSRRAHNPNAQGVGPDRGFGSPWQGLNKDYDLDFHSVMSSIPAWDRPFFSALAQTPEGERESVLETVDSQMADLLRKTWKSPEDVILPNTDEFFQMYNRPSILNPIMDPTMNSEDIQAVTVANAGLDSHDFGMGWREQMRRINNSSRAIAPIDISSTSQEHFAPTNISGSEIQSAIRSILEREGYTGSVVHVNSSYGPSPSSHITINVRRTSAGDLIQANYKNIIR